MSVYVGIDVHRKRSQVAVIDQGGEVLANRNVPNGVEPILKVIGGLPPGTPAAFEAAFGWGWLLELLEDYGFDPHLVHPLQCKAIASARLKNDKVDAAILAQLLRADLLPEAWIAPPAVRQLRAVLRHRAQLVRLRTLLRNRIHAVLADHGHDRPGGCWSGPGRAWLASLDLPAVSRAVIEDDLALIDALQVPIDRLDWQVHQRARSEPAVKVLTQLPGVGPFTALVLLAEIGDISRFSSARKLASWAGLTPTVRGSDRTVRHGHISKQGSTWLRWILCEAAQTARRHPDFAASYQAIAAPPGQEDRHHRDRPQAAHPGLPPAHRRPDHRAPGRRHHTGDGRSGRAHQPGGGRQAPGELALTHEPAHAALDDLTEQPGPRMARSWRPPTPRQAPDGCM
jgi:transposase